MSWQKSREQITVTSSPLEREWVPGSPCPCQPGGCGVTSYKLSVRTGHAMSCVCHSCVGRRNRSSGRRAQARGYRRLGGSALFTPSHEENAGTHSIKVQVEWKSGKQVPASIMSFARSLWARDGWHQAEMAIPAGAQADPSIGIEREGWQILVTLLRRGAG